MKRLLLMGPPGSGKGTQAAIVSARLGISAISTGDIFRANVAGGTPLGIEAKKFISRGEFVPDSVTNAMVAARLARPDAATGFILDGYPRNVSQVDFLDGVLAEQGAKLDCVITLVVDVEEVVKRILRRAEAEGRSDDTEEVIRHRLELFAEQTAPLAEIYADRGLLTRIDGMGPVAEVATRMLAIITNGDDELKMPNTAGESAERA
ncbi:MAG TPA: adenylate kinase [Jiangellaceae bacterium]|nr:adenylate kinase [Jiangellaceae bacterium]